MAGQLRLRVRYKDAATPWFDYLFVSQGEMGTIVNGAGWRISKVFKGEGPIYVAIIEKA